ncbi:unnamed protein product [Peronospora belbahrii]|uniref:Reverse transcriptase Ty1/copia-type domain-containing protein n=1 Tax=Peronospora belbahrii TaxID=622444 RepID=A0AAU9KWI8_9STRA|nr:unnamed protein product [Peronospora belbahrii]
MWVLDLKTDHLDNVVRFRARIVARVDKQRPGIDYVETLSPVARMAMFRLFVAVCVQLELPSYQSEINTAYLNETLGIKQYLESLEGYPVAPNRAYITIGGMANLRLFYYTWMTFCGVPYRGHHDVEVWWHNQLLKQSMLQHVKHAWKDKVYATYLLKYFRYMDTEYRLGIDNQAAFIMSTNPTYSRRTRHIELRWHYVRVQVAKRTVEL